MDVYEAFRRIFWDFVAPGILRAPNPSSEDTLNLSESSDFVFLWVQDGPIGAMGLGELI